MTAHAAVARPTPTDLRAGLEQLVVADLRGPAAGDDEPASTARERAAQEERVDVVWTGPGSLVIPVRRTREVLLNLIREARERLLIVSFAAYKVPEVILALAGALERGVDIRLVLETAEDSRGKLSHDAASAFEALEAVALYVWPAELRPVAGALHAKAVLADGQAALVTSANLTGSAMTANMELGLLVRGGDIPRRLAAHFDDLVARGDLRRVS